MSTDPSNPPPDAPLTARAIAASAICFVLGIPICAIGLIGLRPAGAGVSWPSVAWIFVGGALCAAGMWFKGGEPTRDR